MYEVIIITVIIIIGVSWVKINQSTLNDFLSPFNLLFFSWVLPFLASYLFLSDLQKGISTNALLILLTTTFIMTSISVIPMLLLRRNTIVSTLQNSAYSANRKLIIQILALIFLVVAVIAKYYAEYYETGFPLIQYLNKIAHSASLHRVGKHSRLQVIAEGLVIFGMIFIYSALSSKKILNKCFYYLIAFIPILMGVLKTSKSDLFEYLVCYSAVIYYYYKSKNYKISKNQAFIWIVCIVLFMSSLTIIRIEGVKSTSNYSNMIGFKYRDLIYPFNEIVSIAYGYTALNFENFSREVEFRNQQLHLGASMFRPLFSMVMRGDIPDSLLENKEEYYLSNAANVGTFLRDLYFEGGIILCIIGSILYSALINYIYLRFRTSKSIMWMYIYISLLVPWTWIFFNNYFSILSVYVNIFYILFIFTLSSILINISIRRSEIEIDRGQIR